MRHLLLLGLALSGVLAACVKPGFYDREYVLYDGRNRPAPADGTAEAAPDAPEPAAFTEEEIDALLADPGPATAEPGLRRLFVLENLVAELDRAIADGVGDVAALQQKRADVARELDWRRAQAG